MRIGLRVIEAVSTPNRIALHGDLLRERDQGSHMRVKLAGFGRQDAAVDHPEVETERWQVVIMLSVKETLRGVLFQVLNKVGIGYRLVAFVLTIERPPNPTAVALCKVIISDVEQWSHGQFFVMRNGVGMSCVPLLA
jgi:hypothetical protein